MIEARRLQPLYPRDECAGFWFHRPVHEPAHTRMDERANAHQTRLERDIHIRAGQTVVAYGAARVPQYEDLSMSCRIVRGDRLVVVARDDFVIDDEHGANRHFTGVQGEARLLERGIHERLLRHGIDGTTVFTLRPGR